MSIKKLLLFSLIITTLSMQTMLGYFPINIFRPWDIFLRPERWKDTKFQLTTFFEGAHAVSAENPNGNEVNVLKIYQPTQSSIAMLKGFPVDSDITHFLINELGNPTDNGNCGHFDVTGDFKMNLATGISGRYYFPHNIILGAYLPFYSMELKDVQFNDLTITGPTCPAEVKEDLTSQLFQRVHQFDPTLNLTGWKRTGVGDLVLLAEWNRHFEQQKSFLKDVLVNVRFGTMIPTGKEKNEDDILSIPFGNDGSVGLIFGAGIALTWIDFIRAGIDFEFYEIFGNTRSRRIKVDKDQTDFLLLAKVLAHKDFGFIERFHLFLEVHDVFKGLVAGVAYQFFKHNEDTLSLCTNAFSQDIANTAQNLQEWTMHHALFKLGYDFQQVVSDDCFFKPQFFLFYKYPFNGKRSIMLHTFGASFTLNF